MGFRLSKSIKVAPGVRVRVTKTGLGMTVGGKGGRYSVHSSGRSTATVGIPGTGLSYSSSSGGSRSRSRAATRTPVAPPPPRAPKPGWLAHPGEKALYKAVSGGMSEEALQQVAISHPEFWLPAATLAGLKLATEPGAEQTARSLLGQVLARGEDPARDSFINKYLPSTTVTVPIAPGVDAVLPLGRDVVGLTLAELHQEAGDLDAAINVVEELDSTAHAAVSLAELYLQAGRFEEVVDLTNGLTNEDDATALLLAFRGAALRELGHFEAAREALKEATRSKSRDADIRHFALFERAKTNLADRKRAQARKDAERILAEDARFPGVREFLDQFDQAT